MLLAQVEGFLEVARRRGDYAMMGVAAVTDGKKVRLGYCSAGATPMLIESNSLDVDVQAGIDPLGSVHASKAYQRHLAGVLTQRVLQIAVSRI